MNAGHFYRLSAVDASEKIHRRQRIQTLVLPVNHLFVKQLIYKLLLNVAKKFDDILSTRSAKVMVQLIVPIEPISLKPEIKSKRVLKELSPNGSCSGNHLISTGW